MLICDHQKQEDKPSYPQQHMQNMQHRGKVISNHVRWMMTELRAFVCCAGHLKRGAAYNYSSGALKKRLAVQPAGAAGALERRRYAAPWATFAC